VISPAVPGLPAIDRTLVMGVLNVTPDSFSDGGRYADHDAAVEHGVAMAAEGADIVDVGGESTRPGAARITPDVEAARVLPVVRDLAAAGIVVSVDTTRASVAAAAVDAGALIVNDVSGGLADPEMLRTVATAGVPYVLVHSRGPSIDMQSRAVYDDVVADVCKELTARLNAVVDAGVDIDRIVLDPGIGFAKSAEHNWALLRSVGLLAAIGRPLLYGPSRKTFLGRLLADTHGAQRPLDERDDATTALSAVLAREGIWGVRVHAIRAAADAVRVAAALRGDVRD
jgi:dihydropteroate synthase